MEKFEENFDLFKNLLNLNDIIEIIKKKNKIENDYMAFMCLDVYNNELERLSETIIDKAQNNIGIKISNFNQETRLIIIKRLYLEIELLKEESKKDTLALFSKITSSKEKEEVKTFKLMALINKIETRNHMKGMTK